MKKIIVAGLLVLMTACAAHPQGSPPSPASGLTPGPAPTSTPLPAVGSTSNPGVLGQGVTWTCEISRHARYGFTAQVTNNNGQAVNLGQPTITFLNASGEQLASYMAEQGPGEEDVIAPGATAVYGQIVGGYLVPAGATQCTFSASVLP